MASEIKVDTISEKTSAGGVTIDGLLIKDGNISGDVALIGTTPTFTIGDAGAEDATLLFDGNAQDFYIALDDTADDLVIGLGSTVGTTPAISINSDRDVTISDGAIDFDIASHDTSNGLKLGGTLVTATAAELNIMDGVTSTAAEINLIDGGTARGTTAIADGDGVLINDGGTMRMTTVETLSTYIGGGITHFSQWRMSSDLTGGADPISANLETLDTDGFAILGTDMTVSSGLWTFPATGMWWVRAHGNVYFNGDSRHQHLAIHTTTDNSSYSLAASGYSFLQQTESNTAQNSMEVDFLFDVTNTTNCKVKFAFENVTNSSVVLAGGSSASYTWFTFLRLGDT